MDPDNWTWQGYAVAVLVFGLASTVLLYAILRLQGVLPLNPTHAPGMSPLLSFNTAISFITGTNWQAYEGETAASYFADMAGWWSRSSPPPRSGWRWRLPWSAASRVRLLVKRDRQLLGPTSPGH